MKVNELMLGDLLYNSEYDTYGEVTGVIDNEEIYIDGVIADITDWNPIPLTPEILEKNGIVYDYDEEECVADYHYIKLKGYQYYGDDVLIDYCNGRIKIVRDITGSIEIEEIKYVHELQHALRLLGIEKTIEL